MILQTLLLWPKKPQPNNLTLVTRNIYLPLPPRSAVPPLSATTAGRDHRDHRAPAGTPEPLILRKPGAAPPELPPVSDPPHLSLLLPASFISHPASSLPTKSLCRQPQKSWCQPQLGFSPGTLTFNYKQQACIVVLRNLNLRSQKKELFNLFSRFFFST